MKLEKIKVAKGSVIKEIEKHQEKDYIRLGWRVLQETATYNTNPFGENPIKK